MPLLYPHSCEYDETKEIFDVFNDINDKLELAKDKAQALLMSIDFSPEEIEMIDERLDLYYKFSNKYGKNEEEMLAFLENAKQKRNSILFADEELDRLNKEYDGLLNETVSLAEKLSSERKKVASDFEKNVKNELLFLDMPKMQFFVNFDKGNLSSTGFDKIEFMISAYARVDFVKNQSSDCIIVRYYAFNCKHYSRKLTARSNL